MPIWGNIRLKRGFARQKKRINRLADPLNSTALVDFVFSPEGELITPFQDRKEIAEFSAIVEKIQPERTLEIGTANGGTLFILTRLTNSRGTVISLDMPGGAFGGGYPD